MIMNKTNNRPEQVEVPVNKLYQHDLSHSHTTTMDFFRLQPILLQEVVPDDTHSFDLRLLIQSAPLASQVFGGCHIDLHAFFVPNRIIYSDWDNYIYGNDRTTQSGYTLPYIPASSLFDVMNTSDPSSSDSIETLKEMRRVFGSLGYPVNLNPTNAPNFSTTRYSQLPARVFQRVWWDYYRDSVNIPESYKNAYIPAGGGSQVSGQLFVPRYRTFKKDFISTLLKSPQMGDASSASGSFASGDVMQTIGTNYSTLFFDGNNVNAPGLFKGQQGAAGQQARTSIVPEFTAQALRGVMAMQRYLERLNVTGTRPMERIMSILGVKPSAERLDMAEFLGAKTIKVDINGLVNNGAPEQVTSLDADGYRNAWGIKSGGGDLDYYGQGFQTGYAFGSGQTDRINYTAKEHGFIIVIASIIPEYSNPNSVQRMFLRGLSTPESDRFDFFTPDFDGLGYQEMLLGEVAVPNTSDLVINPNGHWSTLYNPFNVVGYQPKYEDYRYVSDRISGDFNEKDSSVALRNLVFSLSYPQVFDVSDVTAGLNLTTSSFAYRALFDKHFQISSPSLDHFVVHCSIVNDAMRPITNVQLPTELSDLSNSTLINVSNGGVRI